MYRLLSLVMFTLLVLAAQGHSTPGDLVLGNIEDASGLFNERGYLKSNSFTLDGNEVINDFNGNLMYTTRLRYIAGIPGGVDADLTLCYNGSVGHVSHSGVDRHESFDWQKPTSINLPEWIFGLNGIAIQTLNFENEMLSWATVGDTDTISWDDDVSALITGYHHCYSVRMTDQSQQVGSVSILMSDGTVSEYLSLDDTPNGPYMMVPGEYRSFSKEDRSRGYLNSDDTTFTLFREDGIRVVFDIYRPTWKTNIVNYPDPDDSLLMFLPVRFTDRFGHTRTVTYHFDARAAGDSLVIPGRPLVRYAADIEFCWGNALLCGQSSAGLQLVRGGCDGPYEYYFQLNQFSLHGNANRTRVLVTRDSESRKTEFEYMSYSRYGERVGRWQFNTDSGYRWVGKEIRFDQLKRLSHIHYSNGGHAYYSYYYDGWTAWPPPQSNRDALTVDFGIECGGSTPNFPCKKSAAFDALGRDPFFTNMVSAKRRVTISSTFDTTVVSTDSLIYGWTDNEPTDQISYNDTLTTVRLSASKSFDWQSEQIKKRTLIYRYFPEGGPYSSRSRDRGWMVKLMQSAETLDDPLKSYSAQFKVHSWDITCAPENPICGGTFLLDSLSTVRDGVTSTEIYAYNFRGNPEHDSISNLLSRQTITRMGISQVNYYDTSYMFVSDTTTLYSNTIVDSTVVFDLTNGGVRIQKSANELYNPQSSDGYAGQTSASKNYLISNGQIVDSLVTRFRYVRNHPLWSGSEGNLELSISPNGDSTSYHYFERCLIPSLDRTNDSANNPVVYNELRRGGAVHTEYSSWDGNGPFWYRKVAYDNVAAGTDSLQWHQLIDPTARPRAFVEPNRYLSSVTYDGIDRINTIILPGEFTPPSYWYVDRIARISFYPTLDGRWKIGHFLDMCDSDTLWVLHDLHKSSGDSALAAYFQFGDLTGLPSPDKITKVELVVYCHRREGGQDPELGTCGSVYGLINCNEMPPCDTSTLRDIETELDVGWVRFDVTDDFPQSKEFILDPRNYMWVDLALCSSEYWDIAKRPRLDVYYTIQDPQLDSMYSIRLNYDDSYTDGDGIDVTTITRADTADYARTHRTHFDDFGRAVQFDAIDPSATDSRYTEYDHFDRPITQIDQEACTTSTTYDFLDRTEETAYPDPFDPHRSMTNSYYSGTQASYIGLDTLFDLYNQGLFYTEFTDENDNRVIEYNDVLGNLRLRRTFVGDDTLNTYFDYDPPGNLTLIIRPGGDSVNYRYNSYGQLTTEWASDYDTIQYQYDANGNLTGVKDGNMAKLEEGSLSYWRYADYDALNRVTESGKLEASSGSRTIAVRNFYDQYNSTLSRGRLSANFTADDGYSYGERYDYDARGRVTEKSVFFDAELDSTLNDSIYVEFLQDSGTEESVTAVRFADTVTYCLERDWNYGSDSWVAVYHNDSLIDMLQGTGSPPYFDSVTSSFAVAADDTIRVAAHIEGIDTATCRLFASVTYRTYDNYQFYPESPNHHYNLEYSYDGADQIKSITYPDGMVVTYHYDDRGRLMSVGDSTNPHRYASLSYTARDELEQMVLGEGLQTIDYDYTERGWLSGINDGISSDSVSGDLFGELIDYYVERDGDTSYSGNVMDQLVAITDDAVQYAYDYDDLDRLTRAGCDYAKSSFFEEIFTYDANGNRLTDTLIMAGMYVNDYAYTTGTNQLAEVTGYGPNVFTYDANGNVVSDSARNVELEYNIFNRLKTAVFAGSGHEGDDSLMFGYNASGDRISKTFIHNYIDECGGQPDRGLPDTNDSGDTMIEGDPFPPPSQLCPYRDTSVTLYVRGNGQVLAEYGQLLDELKAKYIYAGGRRIAMYDKQGYLHFYLNDHLGSARVVVDTSGTVKDLYSYYAFGAPLSQSVSTNQAYRYTGKPFDDEGGFDLYYYGARYYDGLTGRFTSVDPLADNYPGWSPYVYCLDNPLKLVDPDGRYIDLALDILSVGLSAHDLWDEPSWENAGWLVVDVVGAVLPFVPAAGAVRHSTKLDRLISFGDEAAEAGSAAKKAAKDVPNPRGRRGGPAHQAGVADATEKAKRDYPKDHVKTEGHIKTPGGHKEYRFGDVVVYRNKRPIKAYQVGDALVDGITPVKREREALSDIIRARVSVEFLPKR